MLPAWTEGSQGFLGTRVPKPGCDLPVVQEAHDSHRHCQGWEGTLGSIGRVLAAWCPAESQNHQRWKRPSASSSPTPTQPHSQHP